MLGEYDDIETYLRELQGQPFNAILPLQQAGDVLGVTRATISQRIKRGKLDGVKVGGTVYACALSVLAVIDQEYESVRIIQTFLERVATKGETTNYSVVMPLVGLSSQIPNDRLVIGRLLGSVSRNSHAKSGKILLSALVYNQSLNRPSDAFFGLADQLGYEDAYDAEFLKKHVNKIYKRYAS